MTEEPHKVVNPEMGTTQSGSSLPTFLAVALLLAAVVGGALLMNSGTSDQASIEQPTTTSSTGASSGETGSSDAGPAAVPDKKPESAPAPQQ